VLGLVILSRTAAFRAPVNHGDQLFFLKRKAMGSGGGWSVCLVASCLDTLLQRWLVAAAPGLTAVLLFLLCAGQNRLRSRPPRSGFTWVFRCRSSLRTGQDRARGVHTGLVCARDESNALSFWKDFSCP